MIEATDFQLLLLFIFMGLFGIIVFSLMAYLESKRLEKTRCYECDDCYYLKEGRR